MNSLYLLFKFLSISISIIYIIFWVSISSIDLSFIHIIKDDSTFCTEPYSDTSILWILFSYGVLNVIHMLLVYIVVEKEFIKTSVVRILLDSIYVILFFVKYPYIDINCEYMLVQSAYIISTILCILNLIVFGSHAIYIYFFKKIEQEYFLL